MNGFVSGEFAAINLTKKRKLLFPFSLIKSGVKHSNMRGLHTSSKISNFTFVSINDLTPTHNFTQCTCWKMNNISSKTFEFLFFHLTGKKEIEKRRFSGALYSVCLNTSLVLMSLAKFLRSIVGCTLVIKLGLSFTSFNLYPSCKGRLFNK